MYSKSPLGCAFLLVLLSASPLLAQSFPLPQCPSPAPLTFAGRYHDSTSIREIQTPPRTFRADDFLVAAELDRLYARLGAGSFANYQLSAFINQVGGPLAQVNRPQFGAGESYLPPRVRVEPEDPRSGWRTIVVDGQDRLMGVDYDDRGFAYLGFGPWGFGIVDDNGMLQKQIEGLVGSVGSVRVGAKYYAIFLGVNTSTVYDVTDPRAPVRHPLNAPAFYKYAKASPDGVIAIVRREELAMYSAANLINALPPIARFPVTPNEQYLDVATDGTNFYAVGQVFAGPATFHGFLEVFTPTATGYAQTRYPIAAVLFPKRITYGAGYLAITGSNPAATNDLRLFALQGTTLLPLDLGTYFSTNYSGENIFFELSQVVLVGGTRYLILAANGIGDVYIVGEPTANLSVNKSGPGQVVAGTNVTYQLRIANLGTAPAVNVTVTDALPRMTFVSAAPDAGMTCTAPNGQLHCTTPTLAPCSSIGVAVTAHVHSSATGTLTNTASASFISPNPAPGGNTASVAAVITAEADLAISKTVSSPSPHVAGAPITYSISVSNSGPSDATDVTVTDTIPAGSTFVSAVPTQGSCSGTSTIVCNLGVIVPATTSRIALTIRTPESPGTVTNTAMVSSPTDPTPNAPAIASGQTIVAIPTLSEWMMILMVAALAIAGVLTSSRS